MAKPIAKIRLAQGNVGFYDSLTNIRLTKAAPEAIVYSESNVANIKKAIKEGKVVLKEGSLSSLQIKPIYKREVEIDTAPKTKKIVEKKKPEKIENQPSGNNQNKVIDIIAYVDGIETKEYHRSCNYVTSIEGYNGDKEVHQRLCLQEIIK